MPGGPESGLPAPRRRGFLALALGLAGTALPVCRAVAGDDASMQDHRLRLYNCLTGESFDDVYWSEGRGLPEALARIDWLLRDPFADRCTSIDLDLLHRLSALQRASGRAEPLEVLSAYRSEETNRRLLSEGASRQSQHLFGRAVDFRLPGARLRDLYKLALTLGSGGTGYYPRRGFVHLDTGPDRRWVA